MRGATAQSVIPMRINLSHRTGPIMIALAIVAATLPLATATPGLPAIDTELPIFMLDDAPPSCTKSSGNRSIRCEFVCAPASYLTVEVRSQDPYWPHPQVTGTVACGGATAGCADPGYCSARSERPTTNRGDGTCEGRVHNDWSPDDLTVTCAASGGASGGVTFEQSMSFAGRDIVVVRRIIEDARVLDERVDVIKG